MGKKRKLPPIVWTILYVVVLASLAATPANYRHAADLFLGSVHLVAVLVLTVLGLRAYWSYWRHRASDDPADRLLRRWRKWMHDEGDQTLQRNP
jgi:predicted lysophospholipase L1 biosynthesis ABC-type transport system permease subunit